MELTLNQQAISLAALMFVRGNASFESSLHDEEIAALQVLKQVKAVVPGVVNSKDALCAFCGLYRGPIFRTDDGLMVQVGYAARQAGHTSTAQKGGAHA